MNQQELQGLQEAYLSVYNNELDEGTAGLVAARATKLANQRRGQTPQRRATYRRLAQLAGERETPPPSGRDLNNRSNMTPEFRRTRRGMSDWNIEHDEPGTVTKNPKKLPKQKALGELGEQSDIYDIILSHLLDEGYAETPESAEKIMVNMSEEWRESIVEEMTTTRGFIRGTNRPPSAPVLPSPTDGSRRPKPTSSIPKLPPKGTPLGVGLGP